MDKNFFFFFFVFLDLLNLLILCMTLIIGCLANLQEIVSTMVNLVIDQKKAVEASGDIAQEHFKLLTQAAAIKTNVQVLEEEVASTEHEQVTLKVSIGSNFFVLIMIITGFVNGNPMVMGI